MDVHVRVLLPHVGEQVEVPVDRERGMMPSLHEDLNAACLGELVELGVHLIVGDDVAVGVLLSPVEGAELAIDVADVGVVDVAVDDVGDDLVSAAAKGLGTG